MTLLFVQKLYPFYIMKLQIIYFLPLLNVSIPSNFLSFVTDYLTVQQLTLPTNLLPDLLPSYWTIEFTSTLVPDRYEKAGVESYSFIYNYYSQVFMIALFVVGYLMLAFLDKIRPVNCCKFIRTWKEDCTYNGMIRAGIELFLELFLSAMLNIVKMNCSSIPNFTSFIASCFAVLMGIGFLCFCMFISSSSLQAQKENEFIKQYSVVTEGIIELLVKNIQKHLMKQKLEQKRTKQFLSNIYNIIIIYIIIELTNKLSLSFYGFFFIQRILLVLLIIFLENYPEVQLYFLLAMEIAMLTYIIFFVKYQEKLDRYFNFFNEAALCAIVVLLMFSNWIFYDSENAQKNIGWLMIGILCWCAGQVWAVILVQISISLLDYLKQCFVKDNITNKKDN